MLDRSSTISEQNEGENDVPPSAMRSRRYSLVHQASVEKLQIQGLKRKNTISRRAQLEGGLLRGKDILQRLNDEGIELIWSADATSTIRFAIVLSSSADLVPFVCDVLDAFKSGEVQISHLETRQRFQKRGRSKDVADGWDVLAECLGTKEQLIAAATNLTNNHHDLKNINLFKSNKCREEEVPWFPRHISELDKCSNCVTKYEPTVDPRHPGNGDEAYIARRQFLNDQAMNYRHGDPIPIVQYTAEEHATWAAVYDKLKSLHESHTCAAYRKNLKMLEDEGVLNPTTIPQIADVNKYLQKKTGFMLRPCSGLLSARDFLASLAFRVFQTTTYLRHHGKPHHSPEPDLIHELLGHVPMFADPLIAQMSQDIGLMSLGATDEQIEKLSTVYWFIIEFGLCREDGKLKAIGAGLLSAYGELMHACSDAPEHRDFDPVTTAIQKYEDDDYQPLYFVANSLPDALIKLREYASTMPRPFGVLFDPLTMSVQTVTQTADLATALDRFHMDLTGITHAIHLVNKKCS